MELPVKLKWKQGEDMPLNMAHCQAVVIGDNVYIGGGDSYIKSQVVMVYKLSTKSWGILPPYENKWFGMAAVNDQLVLVGGKTLSSLSKRTSVLGVWNEGSQTWTQPFPELPTPRHSPSVVCYQRWLVVAGGYSDKVELLDTHSKQWYEGSPLPKGGSEMSSTINGNMWYISSSVLFELYPVHQQIFSVCLDELIFRAVSTQLAGDTLLSAPSPWQTLTAPPVTLSTNLVLNGALLSFGGDGSSAVHLYQPNSGSWVKISDLPTKRSQCTCVLLPSGEIFVAGGQNYATSLSGSQSHYLCRCDIATITKN